MNRTTFAITIFLVLLLAAGTSAQTLVSANVRPMTSAEVVNFDKATHLEGAAGGALNEGKYALAEADARQSIALGQHSLAAYQELGTALIAEGKTQEVIKLYSTALQGENNPQYVLPYALVLLRSGQWAKAVNEYNIAVPGLSESVIDDRPLLADDNNFSTDTPQTADLEADIHIGLSLMGMDDYGIVGTNGRDRGVAESREALKLEPDSDLAKLAFAIALRSDGQRAKAADTLQDVIRSSSGDIKAAAQEEYSLDSFNH